MTLLIQQKTALYISMKLMLTVVTAACHTAKLQIDSPTLEMSKLAL